LQYSDSSGQAGVLPERLFSALYILQGMSSAARRCKDEIDKVSERILNNWETSFHNGTLQPSLDNFNAKALSSGRATRFIQQTTFDFISGPLVMMKCFLCGVPNSILPSQFTFIGDSIIDLLNPGVQIFHVVTLSFEEVCLINSHLHDLNQFDSHSPKIRVHSSSICYSTNNINDNNIKHKGETDLTINTCVYY
jgi:hypothetical protein